jgi:hypothetical protein
MTYLQYVDNSSYAPCWFGSKPSFACLQRELANGMPTKVSIIAYLSSDDQGLIWNKFGENSLACQDQGLIWVKYIFYTLICYNYPHKIGNQLQMYEWSILECTLYIVSITQYNNDIFMQRNKLKKTRESAGTQFVGAFCLAACLSNRFSYVPFVLHTRNYRYNESVSPLQH